MNRGEDVVIGEEGFVLSCQHLQGQRKWGARGRSDVVIGEEERGGEDVVIVEEGFVLSRQQRGMMLL